MKKMRKNIITKKKTGMESTITESTKNHEEKSKLKRNNKNKLRNKMEKIKDNIDEIDSGNKDEKNIKLKRKKKKQLRNKMENINDKNNFVPENRKKSNDNLKMSVLKEKYLPNLWHAQAWPHLPCRS